MPQLKRLKTIWLLIGLSLSINAASKTRTTDLSAQVRRAVNDTQRLTAYEDIFDHYQFSNPDSVVYFMKEGLSLFEQHKFQKGVGAMLTILAGSYSSEDMLDIAEKTAKQALAVNKQLNNGPGIADDHNILGIIAGKRGGYSDAASHFLAALKIYKDKSDTPGIVNAYVNLGNVNQYSGSTEKALGYYREALNAMGSKARNEASALLNNNIGEVYAAKKDYERAIRYFERAARESDSPSLAQAHIFPLINLGDVYGKLGDTARAMAYNDTALAIAKMEHQRAEHVQVLINTAGLFSKSNPAKALNLLSDAMEIAELTGLKNLQVTILKNQTEICKNEGNFKEAYLLERKEKSLSDSVREMDKQKSIANVEAIYDLDKLNSKVKELELSKEQQQVTENLTVTAALFGVALLLTLGAFFGRTRFLNNELRRRETRLNNATLVKNKLISLIAHDLSGSMRFVPLALQLYKNPDVPEEEKEALITQLEQNAAASYETLQNMLGWGKAQMQGVKLNMQSFSAGDAAAEVLQFIQIAASNKKVSIINNVGDAGIYADVNHFKFVLRNLLSNAIKFSYRGGTITVKAEPATHDGFTVFSVTDCGLGIAPDKVNSLFTSFGENAAGTEGEKGNGMGLPICKEFVTENGGSIWVESKPGEGSVFYFTMKTGMA